MRRERLFPARGQRAMLGTVSKRRLARSSDMQHPSKLFPVVALLLGCGGVAHVSEAPQRVELDEAPRNTEASFASARDRAIAQHALTLRSEQLADVQIEPEDSRMPLTTPSSVVEVLAVAPAHSLADRERTVMIVEEPGAAPRPALLVPSCLDGQSCGCDEPATHVMATDVAGHDVVLRMRPVEHVERVHQAGSCGIGCGQPPPPRPPYVYWLTSPLGELRIIEVPYDRYTIVVTCDRPLPRP